MRTNIDIDDKLMEAAMSAGNFKTKREAVEEGLRLIARRKTYAGLLALQGQLQWDDSDAAWAKVRREQALQVNEAAPRKHAPKASTRDARSKASTPKKGQSK